METVPSSTRKNKPFAEIVDINLQGRLIDAWAGHSIPEFYQNLFLKYIKKLPIIEAEIYIKQEIKSIEKFNGLIQLFLRTLKGKAKLEEYLNLTMTTQRTKYVQIDFSNFCKCISKLRELNYKAAYYIDKIREKYQQNEDITKSSQRYFFHRFALKLDNFHKILGKGSLSRYIVWQDEYDPFFMSIKNYNTGTSSQDNQTVHDLLSIPVDESYRFLKMKKVLLSWINSESKAKDIYRREPTLPQIENARKYVDFPEIKSELIKQRSVDLQRLKQNQQFSSQIIRQKNIEFDDKNTKIDLNKTRYYKFGPNTKDKQTDMPRKINRMFENASNQPELLSKNLEDSYLNSIANSPLSHPSKRERNSEQIGRIKRSRISQLASNISSNNIKNRNSRVFTENSQRPTQNSLNRFKPQKLDTIQYIPQTPISHYQQFSMNQQIYQKDVIRSIDSHKSRQLQKSLMVNIMISPKNEEIFPKIEKRQQLLTYNQASDLSGDLKLNKKSKNQQQIYANNERTRLKTISYLEENQPLDKNSMVSQKPPQPRMQIEITNAQIKLSNQGKLSVLGSKQYSTSPITNKSQKSIQTPKEQPISGSSPIDEPQKSSSDSPKVSIYSNEKIDNSKEQNVVRNINLTNTSNNAQFRFSQYPASLKNTTIVNNPQTNNPSSQIIEPQSNQPLQQTNIKENPLITYGKLVTQDQRNVLPTYSAKVIENKPQLPSPLQSVASSSRKQESKEQKKQVKIKIGKMTFKSFVDYLNSFPIHQKYAQLYDLKKILKETQFQQTYLTQYLVNNEPGALALSSLVPPSNNFAIRLWIISQKLDATLSASLFKKYIELVEKYITPTIVYFKGEQIEQIKNTGFQFKKQRLYARTRATKPREIDRQFQNFLYCECSHVNFEQKQKEDILFSQEIQRFSDNNSLAAEYLFTMQEQNIPNKLKPLVKMNKNIQNFERINKILESEDIDEYDINKSITISSISLLRLVFQTEIRDPFTACDGFFKFYGLEVINQAETYLYFINLTKNNGKMYFGKGFQSIMHFSQSLRSDSNKRSSFSVPMFTKNLYGRYQKISQKQKGFYGNWEFSFVWQDEMQGRLKHTTESSYSFIGNSFFVGIQIQGSLLYNFEVSKDDFLF